MTDLTNNIHLASSSSSLSTSAPTSTSTLTSKPKSKKTTSKPSSIKTTLPTTPKLTDYHIYNRTDAQTLYVKLLNDNLLHLINYIYAQSTIEPYNLPETRVALSMQMLLASQQLIPYPTASLIIKDIETLRNTTEYLDKWENPVLKRKTLAKEIEMIKKHTEIDETISLNFAGQPDHENHGDNMKDFDLQSSISTLNVSVQCPIEGDNTNDDQRCVLM